jgi:hypothetical protein
MFQPSSREAAGDAAISLEARSRHEIASRSLSWDRAERGTREVAMTAEG